MGLASSKKGLGVRSLTLDDYFMYQERFWSYVDKNPLNPYDCRLWTKACDGAGYGTYGIRMVMCTTHTVSWILFNKMLVPKGNLITHQCGICGYERPNRKCCNPLHLTLGTYKTNSEDKYRDGYKIKLDYNDVEKIRRLAAGGMKQREIGKLFNINQGMVSRIVTGRSHNYIH